MVWALSFKGLVQRIFLAVSSCESALQGSGVSGFIQIWWCLLLLNGQIFFFSYFFPEGRHLPEWVSAVVPVKPTFVAGLLVTSKFFRSVGSWDCLLIQVDFGGFDFSRFFFPKLEPSHCLLKGCEACLIGHF